MICYDNEFPEVARELAQAGAEVILSPTANMLPNAERQVLQIRARAWTINALLLVSTAQA
ncbi:5-aminopentanamidase [Psychrobacter sp. JCM 18900]|nr:5-aminopentanamidase [Psychrobacter sp. JCM 18900]